MPRVDRVHTLGIALAKGSKGQMNNMTFKRDVGEGIVIDDGTAIVNFIERRGNTVRLHIDAPGLKVLRTEHGRPTGPSEKSGDLVISRKLDRDEGVWIGPDILVEPLKDSGDSIRLRTTLSRNTLIDRSEVDEAKLRDLRQKPDDDSQS
jgi:sRNA-binding carbon storage regulator CsrA